MLPVGETEEITQLPIRNHAGRETDRLRAGPFAKRTDNWRRRYPR